MAIKQYEDMEHTKLKKMYVNETMIVEGEYYEYEVLRVPGGWVYTFYKYGSGVTSSMVFIPEK